MPIIRDFNKDLVSMDNPIEARKNDLIRVAELLGSGKGLAFTGKQALLRASIPATKLAKPDLTPEERFQAGKEALAGAATAAAHIATMLAQVPVNGTGTHFLYNELARLVAEPGQLYYAGTGNAANQALYSGRINISVNSKKMKGKKSWDDRGFGRAGESDDIGLTGVLNNKADDTKNLILKDTLPIVFSIVGEPDSTLVFRGFIQGLSDNFSANWQAYQYVGRGEPLYTYTGGTRGISYNMMIPVFSEAEQEPTYKKLNSLLSYTYPKYESNLPQGTVAKMRIGDYISCYATITSLNVTVGEGVPWSTPTGKQRILPQVINLNIAVNVIHERLPERELDGRPRYIGNKPF